MFNEKSAIIGGALCKLIYPRYLGIDWEKDTLIYRSSIWCDDKLISASYKKFFNWDERPLIEPFKNDHFKDASIIEKIDGSTLIISRFRGEYIIRTRGSFDCLALANADEIDDLKVKYPAAFSNHFVDSEQYSMIFEWVSPRNQIVLPYPEADLYLTNIIKHADYSYTKQSELDVIARQLGLQRPKRYTFKDIKDMLNTIENMVGVEGVCVYYNNDQCIRKVKSAEYLVKHMMVSEFNNISNCVSFYIDNGCPEYDEACALFKQLIDFECAPIVYSHISRLVAAKKEVGKILDHMKSVVDNVKHLPRKEAAAIILQKYGNTNRSGMVFNLLDGKSLNKEALEKLYHQILLKNQ